MLRQQNTESTKDDVLHKYLIKKLKRAINNGQSILHISNKQNQITELFSLDNIYTKQKDFSNLDLNKEAYSQIILDLDMPSCDDFKLCLEYARKLLFKHGNLIIIASNMCSFKNKINFLFENKLEGLSRPNRAVTPGFIRQTLLENAYEMKNRAWQYDEKLLVITNKTNRS
jgi:hypothetical protein